MSTHASSSTARCLSWLALAPALVLLPGKALASTGADDAFVDPRRTLDPRLGIDPAQELDPRFDPQQQVAAPPPFAPLRAPVTLSLGVTWQQTVSGEATWGAMLMLGLPLDRLAMRDPRAHDIGDDARIQPPGKPELAPPLPPPKLPIPPEPPLRVPVVVTPDVARGAVEAALRHAHLANPDARIDALATRARNSAALPELSLRVLRTLDTGQTLSPTSYDPTRVTAVDSVMYYLEARTTWRLDRLLFAREEIGLERMRHQRAETQAKLRSQVLRLLFDWQRALAAADNPYLLPEENLSARLRVLEAEAELDLLTGGWFTTWRTAQTAPPTADPRPPAAPAATVKAP
jgi:hypothetical protein